MKKNVVLIIISMFYLLSSFAAADTLWEIDFAQKNYPQGIAAENEYCILYDNHLRFYARESYLTIKFNLPKDGYKNYKLQLTDRGSLLQMEAPEMLVESVYSPYTIMANQSIAADNISIMHTVDRTKTYDVSNYLKPGTNTLLFKLNIGSSTMYEIRKIALIGS